jgi:hypothetical protein
MDESDSGSDLRQENETPTKWDSQKRDFWNWEGNPKEEILEGRKNKKQNGCFNELDQSILNRSESSQSNK